MKTIVWGDASMDVKTGKSADVHINSINIDNMHDIVNITKQEGIEVSIIKMTMEFAIDIGFINLDALSKYTD